MNQTERCDPPAGQGVWIITDGRYSDLDLERICKVTPSGPVKAYRLSQIGRYMLNPGPVEATKRLAGCEIHQRPMSGPSAWLRRCLPRRFAAPSHPPRVILAGGRAPLPRLETGDLVRHMKRLADSLRPFDPAMRQLEAVDTRLVADVVGICEDAGGQRSYLSIQGSVAEKIDYVCGHLNLDVAVILDRAYSSDGLFDLLGIDFKHFDPGLGFDLLRFTHEGNARACVLDSDGRLDFWVEEMPLIQYLLLFQQSIQSNPRLSAAMDQCAAGEALPLKLYFKKQLNIAYSGANLPAIYKEVFEKFAMAPQARETVLGMLKDRQVGVSFNYVPRDAAGGQRLFTEVSVLQDCRVLDAMRDHLPDLVSEIGRRASISEIGRFYLLDSMRGFRNEQ